jgi:hypothetical protein
MDHSSAEFHGLGAGVQLLRLLLLFVIPAALALVARHRPAWLVRAWVATWLLLVVGVIVAFPGAVGPGDIPGFFLLGVPGGMTILWLHRTRRHRVLSHAAAQLASAVVVNVGALALLAVLMQIAAPLWERGGP